MIEPVAPVNVLNLYAPLGLELLMVLYDLAPEDWARPTVCGAWTVKDVAAHMLGGNFGRLWPHNEGSGSSVTPQTDYDELLALIDRDNAIWVEAARRISPAMLVELLDMTDLRLEDHFAALDPAAPARIGVAWAGEDLSPNWFDIAREYTEKWLHQQHIREAVGKPLLTERRWLYPVLDTFLRGLPYAYRDVEARQGTNVVIKITGKAGGPWALVNKRDGWQLYLGDDQQAACHVQLDQDLAWRLFTRGIAPDVARPGVLIEGDVALGEPLLALVSIMA